MDKVYKLDIEHLEDGVWISEMFSKGHHEDNIFVSACFEYYNQYMGEMGEETSNEIIKQKPRQIYGKKVSWFEGNKYKGYTLSYSVKPKKYYFPMTIIYL